MKVTPTLTVTKDASKSFNDIVKKFRKDDVLVGIPATKASRKDQEGPINNAALLFINNFGSPANNIPPRPVMEIGIRNAQEDIAEQFKQAAIKALSQGLSALDLYYNRAGMIAANAIKKAINDQDGIKGPAPATLAAREARGFKGTKSLIVSAQMRNSITWVTRSKP